MNNGPTTAANFPKTPQKPKNSAARSRGESSDTTARLPA